jgi:ATP-dependent protease HslVU (ClpYQ) peptidase subunit
MTTVAWDGRYLCSDSLMVGSHKSMSPVQKIFNIQSDKILAVGLAGSVCDFRHFLRWIVSNIEGHPTEKPSIESSGEEGGVDALVIMRDGKHLFFDSNCTGYAFLSGVEALGSGSSLAMASMLSGRNAPFAVKVASQLDVYTDNILQTYDSKRNTLRGPFQKEHCVKWVSK